MRICKNIFKIYNICHDKVGLVIAIEKCNAIYHKYIYIDIIFYHLIISEHISIDFILTDNFKMQK